MEFYDIFYYSLLTSFLPNCVGKFDLLMLCRDIELNRSKVQFRGKLLHNFSKISLLRAYNAIHNCDIICLSENYLNHDTFSDNDNLKILDYKLIGVDQSSNQKRGGIGICHKVFLPTKVNNISCLKKCLNFSLSVYG